jgi:hypothetical protein
MRAHRGEAWHPTAVSRLLNLLDRIRTEVVMTGKLSPEGEVLAAYGAAMVAAFQVLINCLEENDAVLPGQFPDALGFYMEMVKSRKGDVSDMTLAVLHNIRTATLD